MFSLSRARSAGVRQPWGECAKHRGLLNRVLIFTLSINSTNEGSYSRRSYASLQVVSYLHLHRRQPSTESRGAIEDSQ